MTGEERSARRVRFAKVQGYTVASQSGYLEHKFIMFNPDGERVTWQGSEELCWKVGSPDPDHSAEDWKRLLEWFLKQGFYFSCLEWNDHAKQFEAYGPESACDGGGCAPEWFGSGETLTEAVLCAIDAAMSAKKGEKENGR